MSSIYSLFDLTTTDDMEQIIDMIQLENDLSFDIIPIYIDTSKAIIPAYTKESISIEELLELIKNRYEGILYSMISYAFNKLIKGNDFLTEYSPNLEIIDRNSLGIDGIKLIEINDNLDEQYEKYEFSNSYLNLFFNMVLKGNIIYTASLEDDKISFLLNLLSKISDQKFYLIGTSIKLNEQLINKITAEFMIGRFYSDLVLEESKLKRKKIRFYSTTYFNNYRSSNDLVKKLDDRYYKEYAEKVLELDYKYLSILRKYIGISFDFVKKCSLNYMNGIENNEFYSFSKELLPFNEEFFKNDEYIYLYRLEPFNFNSSGKLYQDLHIGEQITLMRPTSTSYEYAMYGKFFGNVLIRYKINKNTPFICPTCTGVMMSESEFVLPENLKFICVRKWYDAVLNNDGKTYKNMFIIDFDAI